MIARLRLLSAVVPFALLAACGLAETDADGSDDAWLIGTWVSQLSACAGSDDVVIYKDDGSYSSYQEGGSWTLSGDTLEMTKEETWDMGSDAPAEKVADPVADKLVVVKHAGSVLTLEHEDREETTMYRCYES